MEAFYALRICFFEVGELRKVIIRGRYSNVFFADAERRFFEKSTLGFVFSRLSPPRFVIATFDDLNTEALFTVHLALLAQMIIGSFWGIA